MNKIGKITRFAFYGICAAVMLAQSCFAYIDPAASTLIYQILAGVVLVLGSTIGIFWSRIKRKFIKKEAGDEPLKQEVNLRKAGDSEEKLIITADDLLNDDDADKKGE